MAVFLSAARRAIAAFPGLAGRRARVSFAWAADRCVIAAFKGLAGKGLAGRAALGSFTGGGPMNGSFRNTSAAAVARRRPIRS